MRRVADPALAAVEHPLVAVGAHARLEVHGVGAVLGLGQRERADRVQVGHRRQPALLLLLGAEHRDRLHREVRVHAVERAHAAVRARPLHAHEAGGGRAHPRAAVAVDRPARHLQRRDLRDQLERELRPLPVAVDDRRDLLLAERAQPVPDPALVVGELLVEQVEVRHDAECATVSGMDLRSAVEAGWSRQLALLRALVPRAQHARPRAAAQEIVADELADSASRRSCGTSASSGAGLLAAAASTTRGARTSPRCRRGSGGGRSLTFNGHIDVVPVAPSAAGRTTRGARRSRAGACTAAAPRT